MNDHLQQAHPGGRRFRMHTYTFTVILGDQTEMTDDLAEALAAAGCDDALAGSSCGVAEVIFDREAESLEQAVRSAIADVQKAEFKAVWSHLRQSGVAKLVTVHFFDEDW